MKFGLIGEHDSLFRHLVFPLAFRGKAFEWGKGMRLWDECDGTILASLAWERYVPTITHVHGYGCRLASRMTVEEGKKKGYREKNRRIYCGAYQLRAHLVRALAGTAGLDEIVSADLVHHVEAGEIAHTDLRIVLKKAPKFDLEGTKTAILDRLWNTCYGPLIHACECDVDVLEHPSSGLPSPPSGPYRDPRSPFERMWYIVRFHMCKWLWKGRV